MRKIKLLCTGVFATGMLAAASVTSQAQASDAAPTDDVIIMASSSQCFVGLSGNCNTGAVQAVGGGIILNLWNSSITPCTYRVRDVANGVVVRRDTFRGAWRPTVTGLFSSYRLELEGCGLGSWGIIFD
jgi:hypothetical protein